MIPASEIPQQTESSVTGVKGRSSGARRGLVAAVPAVAAPDNEGHGGRSQPTVQPPDPSLPTCLLMEPAC